MYDLKERIRSNYKVIAERIDEAKFKSGRTEEDIAIMAVSKLQPLEYVKTAQSIGIHMFGENRVQELISKYSNDAVMRRKSEVHLIGTLQRNKILKAIQYADCIQSIDSTTLLDAILTKLKIRDDGEELMKPFPIFLQVSCSDFDIKHGYKDWGDLASSVESILNLGYVSLQGLMTIGPNTRDEAVVRSAFSMVRDWKERLEATFSLVNLTLSMGMSSDYYWAILEGSSLIRIGTALFGTRDYT